VAANVSRFPGKGVGQHEKGGEIAPNLARIGDIGPRQAVPTTTRPEYLPPGQKPVAYKFGYRPIQKKLAKARESLRNFAMAI
jgi:hypothetical protein